MTYVFGSRSRVRMEGVHPDLVAVMDLALSRSPMDFTILEGMRSKERQTQLVRSGASQTMNSRHLTGHAIDIAPLHDGQVSWDWPLYHKLAPVVKDAARDLGVPIEWGGDWRTFKDGPHWQLPRGAYGASDMTPRAIQPAIVKATGEIHKPVVIPTMTPPKPPSPIAAFFATLMRMFQ